MRAAAADLDHVAEGLGRGDGSPTTQWSMTSPSAARASTTILVPWIATPSSSPVIRNDSEPVTWPAAMACGGGGGEGGDGALHVHRAAADQHAVDDLGGEGVRGPGGGVAHRHHVGVAGEAEVGAGGPVAGVEVLDLAEPHPPAGEAQAFRVASAPRPWRRRRPASPEGRRIRSWASSTASMARLGVGSSHGLAWLPISTLQATERPEPDAQDRHRAGPRPGWAPPNPRPHRRPRTAPARGRKLGDAVGLTALRREPGAAAARQAGPASATGTPSRGRVRLRAGGRGGAWSRTTARNRAAGRRLRGLQGRRRQRPLPAEPLDREAVT